jgi:hypothetical protein
LFTPLGTPQHKVNGATMSSDGDDATPSGASSPRSQPASSLTHDDAAAETQANAAAIRAARHAEARRRALERAGARAKASRGLKASLQAETAAPSPPPAPRIDENDRERWWEEDEDAENEAESKDDDDDDDAMELAASFETSVAVKTVTAASSGRREMPTRRPRLALPPPSLPTGKPRTNPHQIGVSTHAKHKAKAAVKASASSTHAGVPKTLGMAMCS